MSKRYPRGTAYHEAGHAVVAWSFGLAVGDVSVTDADESGATLVAGADRLTLVEQIAVRAAGIEAEKVFQHPAHGRAGLGDIGEIVSLLAAHGISDESGQWLVLRDQGHECARDRVEMHRGKVIALAERLIEEGRLEATAVMRLLQNTG